MEAEERWDAEFEARKREWRGRSGGKMRLTLAQDRRARGVPFAALVAPCALGALGAAASATRVVAATTVRGAGAPATVEYVSVSGRKNGNTKSNRGEDEGWWDGEGSGYVAGAQALHDDRAEELRISTRSTSSCDCSTPAPARKGFKHAKRGREGECKDGWKMNGEKTNTRTRAVGPEVPFESTWTPGLELLLNSTRARQCPATRLENYGRNHVGVLAVGHAASWCPTECEFAVDFDAERGGHYSKRVDSAIESAPSASLSCKVVLVYESVSGRNCESALTAEKVLFVDGIAIDGTAEWNTYKSEIKMKTIFFAPMRLAPPPEKRSRPLLKMLGELTWLQWGFFWVGWLAWTCDALDFFSVSVSVPALSKQFNKGTSDITQAITLTLLFRSVGAVLFGIFSDRFGRKRFASSSHLGIAMGGIWGLATSTSLENLPVELRGVASGVLQEGYAFGNLLAAVISLKLVPEVAPGWRALFWTASGISVFGAFLRSLLPESEAFLKARRAAEAHGTVSEAQKTRVFIRETSAMLKKHWMLCIYAVLLLTGFNFLAHGSQDLYPTFLQETKGLSAHASVVATIIGNCPFLSLLSLSGPALPLRRLPTPFSHRSLTPWTFKGRDAVPDPIPISVHSPQHSHPSVQRSLPRAWNVLGLLGGSVGLGRTGVTRYLTLMCAAGAHEWTPVAYTSVKSLVTPVCLWHT
ncbi:major facilitator superfamily domain-containing protein [Mycena rosella]|uniref:Major facilitator superfamily domain-containing protein n=1 Tax=Mycena rosella TaxID=1033263 RepID=A0AAD7FHW4_MYCRO|nr:major facilitator superfamily domain-containing protein [Mycena rosella]